MSGKPLRLKDFIHSAIKEVVAAMEAVNEDPELELGVRLKPADGTKSVTVTDEDGLPYTGTYSEVEFDVEVGASQEAKKGKSHTIELSVGVPVVGGGVSKGGSKDESKAASRTARMKFSFRVFTTEPNF